MTGGDELCFFFYSMGFLGMFYFIWQDKNRNLSKPFKQFKEFLINFGAKPKDAAGWKLLIDYFRKDFHPDDHDNYHLATEFFEAHKDYFKNNAFT